jgi:hypothetical protein
MVTIEDQLSSPVEDLLKIINPKNSKQVQKIVLLWLAINFIGPNVQKSLVTICSHKIEPGIMFQ